MTITFIEIPHTQWINIKLINKIVRNINGEYFLLLKNKEKYPLTPEYALALEKLGIAYE